MIKIVHTSDNHLGMGFNNYPPEVRAGLVAARMDTLRSIVEIANDRQADLLVVAGDLFHSLNLSKALVVEAAKVLAGFSGLTLVLPGNHDYYSGNEKLWQNFADHMSGETILLKENRVYSLKDQGLDVNIYPAPCSSKHSKGNNLGWIKEAEIDREEINIGLAHGSIEGLTPDQEGIYYYMKKDELSQIPLDLWLIGHTHVPYPLDGKPTLDRIYNAGVHEPDGMNYRHEGSCFYIEVDTEGIKSERIVTGQYRFLDEKLRVGVGEEIEKYLEKAKNESHLLRLSLSGFAEREFLQVKEDLYIDLEEDFLYLDVRDSELGLAFSKEDLEVEFIPESFPYSLMETLLEEEDLETAQLAYEFIEESRK